MGSGRRKATEGNKYDGLAFVPDPRVFGKCRPVQLNDFVADKPLPRAKPCVSAAGDNKKQRKRVSSSQATIIVKQADTTAPSSTSTKSSTLSRYYDRVLNFFPVQDSVHRKIVFGCVRKTRKCDKTIPNTTSQKGKGSPEKMPRRDNSQIPFECDTFISLRRKTHRHIFRRREQLIRDMYSVEQPQLYHRQTQLLSTASTPQ